MAECVNDDCALMSGMVRAVSRFSMTMRCRGQTASRASCSDAHREIPDACEAYTVSGVKQGYTDVGGPGAKPEGVESSDLLLCLAVRISRGFSAGCQA